MKRFFDILALPGSKGPIEHAAPTLKVPGTSKDTDGKVDVVSTESFLAHKTGYVGGPKERVLDRWLDWVVKASGSEPVFLIILVGLLIWTFLGIPYGNTTNWAVIVSDVQAIVSYIFDSLLMRQQLNGYEKLVRVSAGLRSRNTSIRRMLRTVSESGQYKPLSPAALQSLDQTQFAAELPTENWVGRLSTLASAVMGHFVTVCLYWVCIFI